MPYSTASYDGYMSNLMDRYREALNNGHTVPVAAFNEMDYFDEEESRSAKATRTRERKKWEQAQLDHFIVTGTPAELTLVADRQARLYVLGKPVQDVNLMFVLDNKKITVHSKRSKHLIPQLTALASREGVTLNIVDSLPNYREGVRVAFWPLNIGREIDDSEVVAHTQFRQRQRMPEMMEGEQLARAEMYYGTSRISQWETVTSSSQSGYIGLDGVPF